MPNTKKCVFLDRDGTLIVEKHYLNDPGAVHLEKGVPEALRKLQTAGFIFIIITNQSGIGQQLISHHQFLAVQRRMTTMLEAEGIIITDTYYCPHHPTKGVGRFLKECGCRKPEPGMLLNAIRDHRIDPEKSFMIGDKIADVEAGIRAGVTGILVRTGYGETEASGKEIPIADNLLEAVDRWILR